MTGFLDLEIFARVVETGSMSAAGRRMGLSPAVVSKRVRKLEDRLGTRLLQRTTRQISLTEAGQGYHERAVAILAAVEEAESFVSRRTEMARGTLKVSAPTSFGRMHVAPHLGAFLDANSELTIDLGLTDEFVDIVGDRIDLAIRIGELNDTSLVARKIAPVRRLLCATPAYLDRHGRPQTISDLADHACLAAANQVPWKLHGGDGPVVFSPTGPIETNSSEVAREAILAGIGIGWRSTWDIGPELSRGELEIVLPEYQASERIGVFAVYPSRRMLPAKVRMFIDFLADLYGPQPYWEHGLSSYPPVRATCGVNDAI